MARTLAGQLILRYVVVLGLLLAASAAFQYVELRHFLLQAGTLRLQADALQPLATYRDAVRAGTSPTSAAATLARRAAGPQTHAWVVSPNGRVVARAAGPGNPAPPILPTRAGPTPRGHDHHGGAALAPEPRGFGPPGRGMPPGGILIDHQLVAIIPLGPLHGSLVLATAAANVLGVLRRELRLLLLGGLVVAAAGAASAAVAVRQAFGPLRDIERVAGRIAAGDLEQRAGGRRAPAEVATLARAFDAMVDRLTAAIGEERSMRQQMRRFLDDASHELRTPLAALSGTLEVLQGDAGEDADAVHAGLRAAYRQARRMASLVSGLLTLARADRPEDLPLQETDLGVVLAGVRPLAERVAADHDLRWNVPTRPLPVRASPDALGAAVLNVLDNAARYSPPGTTIRLGIEVQDHQAIIGVADGGPGIAPEHLPRLFERFYRAVPAGGPPGTGLGLAITRSVLRRHGGDATVESAPGLGTTVRLRLPLQRS